VIGRRSFLASLLAAPIAAPAAARTTSDRTIAPHIVRQWTAAEEMLIFGATSEPEPIFRQTIESGTGVETSGIPRFPHMLVSRDRAGNCVQRFVDSNGALVTQVLRR
jgi:hypothetical protein